MEVHLEVTSQWIYELKCWFDLNKGAMVKELNPEDISVLQLLLLLISKWTHPKNAFPEKSSTSLYWHLALFIGHEVLVCVKCLQFCPVIQYSKRKKTTTTPHFQKYLWVFSCLFVSLHYLNTNVALQ